MVETSATSRSFPGWDAVPEDIIPDVDDTRDLGSEEKNWAALWVALAFVTSLTIGGIVNITTIDSWLFINASTEVNGSMNISEDLFVDGNITASYYYGDGSNLSNVNFTELDPYWTGNQSSYFNTTDILGFGYFNITDFDITDYFTSAEILGFGYYNTTDFDIADYYLKNNPFGFYNSTDFDIADYYLKNNPFSFWNDTYATFNKTYADTLYYGISNPFSYWNSTFATFNKTYADTLYSTIDEPLWTGNQSSYFNTTDILGFSYWNSTFATFNKTYADTLYYGISNPFTFWNSTFATFNKTYADTLYSTISEPLWTGNSTLVPYLASANVFTANQNLTGINITGINCMIYDSGGAICSGV